MRKASYPVGVSNYQTNQLRVSGGTIERNMVTGELKLRSLQLRIFEKHDPFYSL